MQELRFLRPIPSASLEGAIALLKDMQRHISFYEKDGHWFVFAGHTCLLKTPTRDAVDAFIYGMALVYSTLPADVREKEKQRLASTYEPQGGNVVDGES